MLPALRMASSGGRANSPGPNSVMPKPCLKRMPFSGVYFSTSGTGRGAPPLVQKRRLLRSAVSQFGAVAIIWYMVGTAAKTVTR